LYGHGTGQGPPTDAGRPAIGPEPPPVGPRPPGAHEVHTRPRVRGGRRSDAGRAGHATAQGDRDTGLGGSAERSRGRRVSPNDGAISAGGGSVDEEIGRAAKVLDEALSIALACHVNPDPDALG